MILLLAAQKAKRMEDAQHKLYNGKIPIQVWVSEVASVLIDSVYPLDLQEYLIIITV